MDRSVPCGSRGLGDRSTICANAHRNRRRLFVGMRGVGGTLVDAAFGESRQLLVSRLLLVERLLQQIGCLGVSHGARPRDQGAVRGHLVVLGPLARGNQACVHRRLIEVLFHDRLAFFNDAGNAVAVFAANSLVEALEDTLQPIDLASGLLEMRFKRVAQFRRRGGFRQFRKRLRQLSFCVVRVPQLVDEGVV